MAWIESHADLAQHPKTRKLARLLKVSVPTAIGHLHCLWHWCLKYADDGDLARFEDYEIADAALWDGEYLAFIESMIEAGWLDQYEAEGQRLRCRVHDWFDYAGKLVEKRRSDAARKRSERQGTPVQRTSNGHPTDGAGTVPNPTVPNPTKPNNTNSLVGKGVQGEAASGADAPPPGDPLSIKRASRAERETRIPADFPITDRMRAWARENVPGLDIDDEHREFCTYWGGDGGRKLDWEQTWQNGMLKAHKRQRSSGVARYGAQAQADMNSGKLRKFVGA